MATILSDLVANNEAGIQNPVGREGGRIRAASSITTGYSATDTIVISSAPRGARILAIEMVADTALFGAFSNLTIYRLTPDGVFEAVAADLYSQTSSFPQFDQTVAPGNRSFNFPPAAGRTYDKVGQTIFEDLGVNESDLDERLFIAFTATAPGGVNIWAQIYFTL